MSRQNCLPLNDNVTSQGPECLCGVCTLIACGVITSPQRSAEPKTTCKPSKKLSPTMTTVVPPLIGPSLGHTAFMTGVASWLDPGEEFDIEPFKNTS